MRRRGGGVTRGSETKEAEGPEVWLLFDCLCHSASSCPPSMCMCVKMSPGDNKQEAAVIVGQESGRDRKM